LIYPKKSQTKAQHHKKKGVLMVGSWREIYVSIFHEKERMNIRKRKNMKKKFEHGEMIRKKCVFCP